MSIEARTPVYEFDYIAEPELKRDVHGFYEAMHRAAPPLFWTNANEGHWVVNSADLAIKVLRNPEVFSNRFLSIPPNPAQTKMIPESLDPPEHRRYRQLLRPYFESKAIEPLAGRIEEWARELIGNIAAEGKCEFVEDIGSRFPVSVFMELFGFPLEKFDFFRASVVRFFSDEPTPAERGQMSMEIVGVLMGLIHERRAEPRQDLMSELVSVDFEGRKLTDEELVSIGFLMFFAGLDTVVNALSFGMRHLAGDAKMQEALIADPAKVTDAVDEFMRRYSFVSVPRYVAEDTELGGIAIPRGDRVLVPLQTVGWDQKLNACPMDVTLDRKARRHAGFGSGIHTCLGIHLARLEMIIFYRVWFQMIGTFSLQPNSPARCRGGTVQAIEELHLEWMQKGTDR